MLSKNRFKRLTIVMLLPLLLLGAWFAQSGISKFFPAYYNAECGREMCTSWESSTPPNWEAGLYIGNPLSGGAALTGQFAAWLIPDGETERKFFSPPQGRPDGGPCYLEYFEKLDRTDLRQVPRTTRTVRDFFQLTCGQNSLDSFRFEDRNLQIALVDYAIANADNKAEFQKTQSRRKILGFVVPFALYILSALLAYIISKLLRFVWHGCKTSRV